MHPSLSAALLGACLIVIYFLVQKWRPQHERDDISFHDRNRRKELILKNPLQLPDDTLDWLYEAWAWMLRKLGGNVDLEKRKLVTPTPDDFPVEGNEDVHVVASWLLSRVTELCGLNQPDVEAVSVFQENVQEDDPKKLHTSNYHWRSDCHYEPADEQHPALIPYLEEQTVSATLMIANFAHSIAHYIIESRGLTVPGDEEQLEFYADLIAGYLGFGVFQANACVFHIATQDEDPLLLTGSYTWGQGFLSSREMAFSLAIFAHLKGMEPKEVLPHLDPSPRTEFKQTYRFIAKDSRWVERLQYLRSL